MESLKIDVRGFSESEKLIIADKFRLLGYVGNPMYEGFYSYCIYASGTPSKHGFSLSFGNSMKTFSKNKGREIKLNELNKMISHKNNSLVI